MSLPAAEYVAAIRKILACDNISEDDRARRIDELKYQRLTTLKEFAFEKGVDYRTVRRWVKSGKVPVVDTPVGKRIMSSFALSPKATPA
jgi:hypothetical protein